MTELTVDPEFRELFPPLTDHESNNLRESLERDGCLDPIVTMANSMDTIVDGHHRYAICLELGIPFSKKVLRFDSRADAMQWMWGRQAGRRNMSPDDLRYLRGKIYSETKKPHGGNRRSSQSSGNGCHLKNTSQQVADQFNVSERTIRNDAQFAKVVDEERATGKTKPDAIAAAKKSHVTRNSGENEWYTPPEFDESVREAMGTIDLDPASCKVAQRTIKAKKYYTITTDGLSKPWRGRVFLNPPYASNLVTKFAAKLLESIETGTVTQAVVLLNNATETKWFQSLLRPASSVCFPSGRIKFLDAAGVPANTPLQGQALLYFGTEADRFVEVFQQFGVCVTPNTALERTQ